MAAVTLGLCIPIIAYKTDQSLSNELVLVSRWGLVAALCAVAFAVRLALRLAGAHWAGPRRATARKEAIVTVADAPPSLVQRLVALGAPLFLGFALLFPVLA